MQETSRVLVTNENLRDIEEMLSETVQRVVNGSRYSHLSASRKSTITTFVTQKTNAFLQDLELNCREATEEEIPLESVDSKLLRQVEELTQQLNNVEQQLIKEREVKVQEYETFMAENLRQRYNIDESVENLSIKWNNAAVISEPISIENITRLYENLKEEWQETQEFSSFQDKLTKVSIVLQNMLQTDMNSLRPVLESVSSLLKKASPQELSHVDREFAQGASASILEGKLLAILRDSDGSSALNDACP